MIRSYFRPAFWLFILCKVLGTKIPILRKLSLCNSILSRVFFKNSVWLLQTSIIVSSVTMFVGPYLSTQGYRLEIHFWSETIKFLSETTACAACCPVPENTFTIFCFIFLRQDLAFIHKSLCSPGECWDSRHVLSCPVQSLQLSALKREKRKKRKAFAYDWVTMMYLFSKEAFAKKIFQEK